MDGQKSVIHPLSSAAPLPQFELWSIPGTQIQVQKDIITEVRPFSTLASNQPIEFIVSSAVDEYINLSETYLYVKARVKITKDDKSDPRKQDWDSVVPAQYFMHSIFSQCDVRIGDKDISLSPQTYHYRAFLEAFLSYSKEAKLSHLRSSMWTQTKEDRNRIVRPVLDGSKEGKWFEMMGRLHTDLTFQEKSLLGGVELRIRLVPNDPKFYFNCSAGIRPELELAEVSLHVHKAKVFPDLVKQHMSALATGNTRYAITRCEVRQQGIPQGQLDAILENVIRGQMPRRMLVFLVDTTSFNGSLAKDGFEFKHFDVNYIVAYVGGVQFPSKPYTPDFTDDLYLREFLELYSVLNQNRTDTYLDLDYESYGNGKTIFAFDFAPDLSNGPGSCGHVSYIETGAMRLHFRFKRQLGEAVNVLMYCEFDNMIEIDANRNAATNFN